MCLVFLYCSTSEVMPCILARMKSSPLWLYLNTYLTHDVAVTTSKQNVTVKHHEQHGVVRHHPLVSYLNTSPLVVYSHSYGRVVTVFSPCVFCPSSFVVDGCNASEWLRIVIVTTLFIGVMVYLHAWSTHVSNCPTSRTSVPFHVVSPCYVFVR